MIAIVLRHELRRTARDRAMLVLLLLFTALAAFAGINGAGWAEQRRATVASVATEANTMLSDQIARAEAAGRAGRPDRAILRPIAFPYAVTLPPRPLAALSIGQAEAYPFAARFLPLMSRYTIFDRSSVNTENARVLAAGRFDLAFLIVFLLPIFILAATYDLWTEERDRGTAALVLAQPVKPGALLAAKALARGGAVLVPAVAIVLAVLAFVAFPDPAGLAALAGIMLLYGLFWIALAAVINIFTRRAAEAAVAAGAAWLTFVVIGPALVAALVDIALPPASRADLVNAVRGGNIEAQAAGGTINLTGRTGLKGLTPLQIQTRFDGGRFAEVKAGEAKAAPIAARIAQRSAERIAFTQAARLALPSVALQNALDRIAGTDASRAAAFQASADAFVDETRAFFARYIEHKRMMPVTEAGSIPRYAPPEASLVPLAIDAMAILAFTLLLLALAAHGLRRHTLLGS